MSSISRLADLFIEYLEKNNKTRSTIIAYRKDIDQLVEYLQKNKVDAIESVNVVHLQQCLNAIAEKYQYTPKTISRKINSFRTFFKFLIEEQKQNFQPNPAMLLQHPKIETKLPRILSKIEYMAVRDASRVDTRLYTMVELILQSGVRIGELQRLRMNDLKISPNGQNYLFIQEYGSHPSRSVPLNESAFQALQKYLKERPKSANDEITNIFLTKTGHAIPTRNIRTSISRAFKIAGIKQATVNDLRNTFIAHHLAKGKSLLVIAKIVGHKRISTTEKYLQALQDKSVKEKLENL